MQIVRNLSSVTIYIYLCIGISKFDGDIPDQFIFKPDSLKDKKYKSITMETNLLLLFLLS